MKHWALYQGSKDWVMTFLIQTLPTTNKQVYLPVDECDNLTEKELAERLTTAIQGILQGEEVFIY